MKRREFIKKVFSATAIAAAGGWWIFKKVAPRKFIEAIPLKEYPGWLGKTKNFDKPGEWSG